METREQAIEFLKNIVSCLGTDFHPDDPMDWYFGKGSNEAQDGVDKCFEILGDEVYEISLNLMYESIGSM